jgi:hypothetical protein
MLPFGVAVPATLPQGSEIPEGLMNNPVFICSGILVMIRQGPSLKKIFKTETPSYSENKREGHFWLLSQ